jgi:hypothetical protein
MKRLRTFMIGGLALLVLAAGSAFFVARGGRDSARAQAVPSSGSTAMTGRGGMGGTAGPVPVSQLPKTPVQSVTQMNGLVMPAGMIVTRDTSMEEMAEMAAVPPSKATYTAPATARAPGCSSPRWRTE